MGTRCAPAKLRPLSTEAQEMARQNIQTITGSPMTGTTLWSSATCSPSRTGTP